MTTEAHPADGLIVVDKPSGPTSHDVVARIRRLLGVRRVGHAGTLDPLASGVLVVLVGQATKLAAFLTLDVKRYEAVVVLGVATDTLDAEGVVTARAPLPDWLADPRRAAAAIDRCLDAERRRSEQQPPTYSAIKVGGRPAHRRARAGEALELAPRPVVVHALDCLAVEGARLTLQLRVSKGYYVRSLARDIGARLGLPAHLGGLRRTASGSFELDRATPLDASADELRAAMLSLADAAASAMPTATLTPAGVLRARRGQPLEPDDFTSTPPTAPAEAWLDAGGALVAIGCCGADGGCRVIRGIALAQP